MSTERMERWIYKYSVNRRVIRVITFFLVFLSIILRPASGFASELCAYVKPSGLKVTLTDYEPALFNNVEAIYIAAGSGPQEELKKSPLFNPGNLAELATCIIDAHLKDSGILKTRQIQIHDLPSRDTEAAKVTIEKPRTLTVSIFARLETGANIKISLITGWLLSGFAITALMSMISRVYTSNVMQRSHTRNSPIRAKDF